ncbi:MAG TPA: hypothetical protein PKJ16_09480 [Spirochaetota bacterium]|nr:hypothetical protein [Spirochaetota bacterium]HPU87558.1 hypothetical protein [Spirochaetota bacterium]
MIRPARLRAASFLIAAWALSCSSFPETLPPDRFSIDGANRAGLYTEIERVAVGPDGGIALLARIDLRDDTTSSPRTHLAPARLTADGGIDASFAVDPFFARTRAYQPHFLFAGGDGGIVFSAIVRACDATGKFTGDRPTLFTLSPDGSIRDMRVIAPARFHLEHIHDIVPVGAGGTLGGLYVVARLIPKARGTQSERATAWTGVIRLLANGDEDAAFEPCLRDERTILRTAPTAVMRDGGIALWAYRDEYNKSFEIIRLTARGRADPSFRRGAYRIALGGTATDIGALAVDTRGRLLLAVTTASDDARRDRANHILRLRPDGGPDTSFIHRVASGTADVLPDLVPHENGSVSYLTRDYAPQTAYRIRLHRIDGSGVADATFSDATAPRRSEQRSPWRRTLIAGSRGSVVIADRHIEMVQPTGKTRFIARVCSDFDFTPNATAYERARDGCWNAIAYAGFRFLELFGWKMKTMP